MHRQHSLFVEIAQNSLSGLTAALGADTPSNDDGPFVGDSAEAMTGSGHSRMLSSSVDEVI
jgi:hypothetical protein